MELNYISTSKAPAAIGPYSQAVMAGNTLYISGQLPIDMTDGTMPEDIKAQVRCCMDNIGAILNKAGGSYGNAVKMTIFLKDMDTFAAVNEAYGSYFELCPPARSTVEVSRLPKGAMVEIDCIAVL